MLRANTDPRVDDYIAGLPDWQQRICQQVREIVHEADSAVEETIKRRIQPYFVLHGNVCALLATKDHVNVFIYDPIAPDPHGIINQGHGNATARSVQLFQDDVINRAALRALLEAVIRNNRAGGWRKVRTTEVRHTQRSCSTSGDVLRLLLTSGGVTNPSIVDALVGLIGKPTAEATALCIPTAQWGHPMCGPVSARGFVSGLPPWGGMTAMEWKSLGLLELSALPSIGKQRWVPWVRETDVLLVDGGDATYVCHWMRESGWRTETVWVGVERRQHGDDSPGRCRLRRVAAYAIDDQTAIKVADGTVEVVSEGHWKQFC